MPCATQQDCVTLLSCALYVLLCILPTLYSTPFAWTPYLGQLPKLLKCVYAVFCLASHINKLGLATAYLYRHMQLYTAENVRNAFAMRMRVLARNCPLSLHPCIVQGPQDNTFAVVTLREAREAGFSVCSYRDLEIAYIYPSK